MAPEAGTPPRTGTSTPESTGTLANTGTPARTTPTWTPTGCAVTFTDVAPQDYFYEAVGHLYCMGAISGYIDDTFRPYNTTTRAQLTKVVVLARGWPIDTTGGPHFTDVPTDHPFYAYVETASQHG